MIRRFGIRKRQRLRSPLQFARVYDGGMRAGDGHLLVFAAPNDLGTTRFGLSVSRKHGNAARRARLKRLLREAFRLSQHDLPQGLDLVLIPRQGSGAELDDYRGSLVRNAERLARRLAPREAP
jgi:ribonuclease P protein component